MGQTNKNMALGPLKALFLNIYIYIYSIS